MTERNFTDEQIIKALECCVNGTSEACLKCAFGLTPPYPVCKTMVEKYALDLINRQVAEICDLKDENKGLKETNDHLSGEYIALMKEKDNLIRTYAECQTEAIKEFAEQVKQAFYYEFDEIIPSIMADKIDALVKEMTEGK